MGIKDAVSTTTPPEKRNVKVNRLALALLTAIAVMIGVAPALLILDRSLWLLYASVLVLIAAMWGAFTESTDTIATYQPSWQEFLLAGLGTIFVGALTGLLATGLVYGIPWLAEIVAGWLGTGISLQRAAHAVALFLGGIVGLLGLIVTFGSPNMMVVQLYPDTAGVRTAFYSQLTVGWRRKMSKYLGSHWRVIVVVTLVVCLCVNELIALWGRAGAYLALNLALLVCAYPLFFATAIPNHFNESQVQKIKKLLEAAGCRVVVKPRTGVPASDPLLLELDLLADNGQRAMAVAVRTGTESSAAVEATSVSALSLAAWTCSRNNTSFELRHTSIEPWLILVDREIKDDAETIAEQQSIRVYRLTEKDLTRIDQSQNAIDLRQITLDFFGLVDGGELKVCAGEGEMP
jgi:hypothetical protein